MDSLRQHCRRLDDRVRALSRLTYALLMGIIATVCVLAVGYLVTGSTWFEAVAIGVAMAVLYYASDFNSEN